MKISYSFFFGSENFGSLWRPATPLSLLPFLNLRKRKYSDKTASVQSGLGSKGLFAPVLLK